jgi:hypothetical protein
VRAKERVGGGADAHCKEKAIAVLSLFIVDSLDNNLVREHQHCNKKDKDEVFQDAVSRKAHKLYSNSCFALANGKFCMSLKDDIEKTTNVLYRGGHDKPGEGGCDEGWCDNGSWDDGCQDDGGWHGVHDSGGGQYHSGRQDDGGKLDCGSGGYGDSA